MARKRKQEKKRKQQSKLLGRLERLALRREDDKFFRLAAEVPDLESAGLADLYAQVFERSLWSRLKGADPERVAELLSLSLATVRALPASRFASATLAIEAGRLEDARRLLEQLDQDLEAPPDGSSPPPAELVRQLSALVTDDGEAAGEGPIADFCRLRRILARYGAGEIKRLPNRLRLDWAPARDTLELVRALAAVRPEKWPETKNLRRVRRSARALLDHQPLDPGVEALASAAIQLTRAARSEVLTMRLDHGPPRVGAHRLLQVLHQERSKLAALASDRAPAALAGLRDLVTRRCRRLLTRWVETGGSLLLARAHAAAGGAFDDLIEVSGEADSGEADRGATWSAIHSFLDQEDLPALTRWLEAASAAATGVSRTTLLWALELAFLDRSIDAEQGDEDDDSLAERDDDEPPKPSRALRQMLVRLQAMSRQLEQCSAREDERRSVARFLRNRLINVFGCDSDERILSIAETLLRYLQGDAALLLMALGAAFGGEQPSTAARLAERIRQRKPASEDELPLLYALLEESPASSASQLEAFLRGVKPLFGAAWPQAKSAAAKVIEAHTMIALSLALYAEWSGSPSEGRELRQAHLGEIEELRSIFGDESQFHVALVLTREVFGSPATFRRACKQLLAERQDLEAALSVVRLLDAWSLLPTDNKRITVGLEVAVEAVVHRLDSRWSLWGGLIESLLPQIAAQGLLKVLTSRLREILGDTTLASVDRKRIESYFEHAEMIAAASKKTFGRTARRPRKRRAKKKVPKAASPSQLELFERLTLEDES